MNYISESLDHRIINIRAGVNAMSPGWVRIRERRGAHIPRPYTLGGRDRLQLGEPVAAAGAAARDGQRVAESLRHRLVKTRGGLLKYKRYDWPLL